MQDITKKSEFQQDEFLKLRYEYYSGGRELFHFNNVRPATYLMSFAVELSMKQLLSGSITSQKLLYKHDIPELHFKCVELGLLKHTRPSDDLLEYTDYMLNQRYPSQIYNVRRKAAKLNRAVTEDSSMLLYFDDYLDKLDMDIEASTGTPSYLSIAARDIQMIKNRAFFHNNGYAINRLMGNLEQYLEGQTLNDLAQELVDGLPESLWNYSSVNTQEILPYDQYANRTFIESYRYADIVWIKGQPFHKPKPLRDRMASEKKKGRNPSD